jgi:hypothetical protein
MQPSGVDRDRVDLALIAAKWKLGYFDVDAVLRLADELLAAGWSSPKLVEVYATDRDELRWTVDRLFSEALVELGVDVPSADQAWRQLAVRLARDHLDGRLAALEVTRAFKELNRRLGSRYGPPFDLVYELELLEEHMGWVESHGRSYDGTAGEFVLEDVRRAAKNALDRIEPTLIEPANEGESPYPRRVTIRVVSEFVGDSPDEPPRSP